jgi:uroporphyrinogen III methyltransferase/synthase
MLWKLPALRQPLPGHLRVASIGPQTAQALRRRGVEPDFVPGEYVAEAILPGLGDLRGRSVLLPCAELARRDLPDGILAAGGVVDVVPLYQTLLPARADPAGLAALKSGVDVITLTSPSTVQNFVLLAREQGLDPLDLPGGPVFACIGPITRQAAEVERLPRLLVAAEYTGAGLIRAIQSIYSSL